MLNRRYQNALLSDEFKAPSFYHWPNSSGMVAVKGEGSLVPIAGTAPSPLGGGSNGDPVYDLGSGGLEMGGGGGPVAPAGHTFLAKLGLIVGPESVTNEFRTLLVVGSPGAAGPSVCVTSRRFAREVNITVSRWTGSYWSNMFTVGLAGKADILVPLYVWAGGGRVGVTWEGAILPAGVYSGAPEGEAVVGVGSYAPALALWPGVPAPSGAGSENRVSVESVAAVPSAFFDDAGVPSFSAAARKPELMTLLSMDILGFRKKESGNIPPLDNSKTVLTGTLPAGQSVCSVEDASKIRVPGGKESTHVTLSSPSGDADLEVLSVIDVDVMNNQLVVQRLPGHPDWPAGTLVRGWVIRRDLEDLPGTLSALPSSAPVVEPTTVVTLTSGEIELANGTFSIPNPENRMFIVLGCGLIMYGEDGTTFDLSFGYGPGKEALMSAVTPMVVSGAWDYVRHQAPLLQHGRIEPGPSNLSFTVANLGAPGDVYANAYYTGFYWN